ALRDLTDPLSAFTVAGLLVAYLLGWRSWVVGLWAAAAVFSREQNVAVVGIVLVTALCQRKWAIAAWMLAAAGAWAGWVAYLHHLHGEWPFAPANVGLPLRGVLYRLQYGFSPNGLPIHFFALGVLGVQVALSLGMGWFRPGATLWLTA